MSSRRAVLSGSDSRSARSVGGTWGCWSWPSGCSSSSTSPCSRAAAEACGAGASRRRRRLLAVRVPRRGGWLGRAAGCATAPFRRRPTGARTHIGGPDHRPAAPSVGRGAEHPRHAPAALRCACDCRCARTCACTSGSGRAAVRAACSAPCSAGGRGPADPPTAASSPHANRPARTVHRAGAVEQANPTRGRAAPAGAGRGGPARPPVRRRAGAAGRGRGGPGRPRAAELTALAPLRLGRLPGPGQQRAPDAEASGALWSS